MGCQCRFLRGFYLFFIRWLNFVEILLLGGNADDAISPSSSTDRFFFKPTLTSNSFPRRTGMVASIVAANYWGFDYVSKNICYTYGSDHHLILEVSVVILSWYFVLNYPILCYTYQQVCQVVEIHSRLPQWSPHRLETWWIHGRDGGGWCWWCLEGWDLTKISDRESGHQAEATLTTAIWVNWREESVYDGPLLTYHSGYSATMSHDTISAMDICKFSLLE